MTTDLVCPDGHAMDDGLFECPACGARREPRSIGAPAVGDRFVSRSGRRWECISQRGLPFGTVTLMPLGPGAHSSGGGVKCRQVEIERLAQQTHGWRQA